MEHGIPLVPNFGTVYKNKNGGYYMCIGTTQRGGIIFERCIDFWTLEAIGTKSYTDGTIDWSYSKQTHYPKFCQERIGTLGIGVAILHRLGVNEDDIEMLAYNRRIALLSEADSKSKQDGLPAHMARCAHHLWEFSNEVVYGVVQRDDIIAYLTLPLCKSEDAEKFVVSQGEYHAVRAWVVEGTDAHMANVVVKGSIDGGGLTLVHVIGNVFVPELGMYDSECKAWLNEDEESTMEPDVVSCMVTFEVEEQQYYCTVYARNIHEALGRFFMAHPHITYHHVVDHVEI